MPDSDLPSLPTGEDRLARASALLAPGTEYPHFSSRLLPAGGGAHYLFVMEIQWLAFDADDTLWKNEPFFFEAQDRLEALLKPYTDFTKEGLSDALYRTEKRNLGLFGYGAKGFTLSMIETAIELSKGEIKGWEVEKIIEWGKGVLDYPIQLFDEVDELLPRLKRDYRLIVITKGDLFNQESKLARSGLAAHFEQVEIVSDKSPETYQRIADQYGMTPGRVLMIGNSLKSDILPALEVGMKAVYIPREVYWQHEMVEDTGDAEYGVIHSLQELPEYLSGI